MKVYDLVIIGGGVSGTLAAINGKKNGIENILIIDKECEILSSLNLGNYNLSTKKFITGLEYKEKLLKEFNSLNIDTLLNTMALNIDQERNIVCMNPQNGVFNINGNKILLCNGAKEKGRNALNLPGDRVSGVLTLGNAKKILNMEGISLGENILIYGKENLHTIKEEIEKNNLNIVGIIGKNLQNYLNSISQNLYEGYNLVEILGENRTLQGVIEKGTSRKAISCDTIIIAQGLLSDGVLSMRSGITLNPETTGPKINEFFETSRENIYACGDGIFIHNSIEELEVECKDLIDVICNR
ncbi:MAG: FAD-dependent oxidoreductase [Clostridium sp.]